MGQKREIVVPNIGDFSDVPVVEIIVAEGDSVDAEEPILTLESDKAVMEVPSPWPGTITGISVTVGDTVSEGDVLAVIETTDEDADKGGEPQEESKAAPKTASSRSSDTGTGTGKGAQAESASGAEAEKGGTEEARSAGGGAAAAERPETQSKAGNTKGPASAPAESQSKDSHPKKAGRSVHASPSVRLFARELGADLTQVSGTGPKGRILKEDVQKWVKERLAKTGAASAEQQLLEPESFKKFGDIQVVDLSRIKRISGPRLSTSWRNIPHVTHFDEADITETEEFRKRINSRQPKDGVHVTPLAFAVMAAIRALQEFPDVNSSFLGDGKRLIRKNYYHIGFAVDTAGGLMVPVIRNADRLGLIEIAAALAELGEKARKGSLSSEEMSGAGFSISSLGGIGGTGFTPIINPPEVAILGLSRSKPAPVWDAEAAQFKPRYMLPFSLSYDHRVIDGAEAARFCKYFGTHMADLRESLL